MAVVVFLCVFKEGEGKLTAVRGADTNIWLSLFAPVRQGDGNKEPAHLYTEVYIRVLCCWPGKSLYLHWNVKNQVLICKI